MINWGSHAHTQKTVACRFSYFFNLTTAHTFLSIYWYSLLNQAIITAVITLLRVRCLPVEAGNSRRGKRLVTVLSLHIHNSKCYRRILIFLAIRMPVHFRYPQRYWRKSINSTAVVFFLLENNTRVRISINFKIECFVTKPKIGKPILLPESEV